MSLVETEQVLVVPTAEFRRLGYFQGFSPEPERYVKQLLDSEQVSFRPRGEMEEDPSFKQLIPYVIFRHRERQGAARLFAYTRGSGQGEARLHAKRSIGVGGHISLDDVGDHATDPYRAGLLREVEEEVALATPYRESCVGLINDDETEVGRVHLGVVHIFDVEQPEVAAREDDIQEARFYPLAELLADQDRFETWSQICLRALFA